MSWECPTCGAIRSCWGPEIYRRANTERDRLRAALDMINMLACYASEEDTDSREQVLLQIGKLARGEVSPEVPRCCAPNPEDGIATCNRPKGHEGSHATLSGLSWYDQR